MGWCRACDGLGRFRRGVPCGSGGQKCLVCLGDGRRRKNRPVCVVCRGLGGFKLDEAEFGIGTTPCALCDSKGWTTNTPCVLCRGHARFDAITRLPSVDGKYRCHLCKGKGRGDPVSPRGLKPCDRCHGFGRLDAHGIPTPARLFVCDACSGKGMLSSCDDGEAKSVDERPSPRIKRARRDSSLILVENARLKEELARAREAEVRVEELRKFHARKRAEGAAELKALAASSDLATCVVCLEREKSTLLLPCAHLATCRDCTLSLGRQHQQQRESSSQREAKLFLCPICRQPVETTTSVLLA